MATKKRKKNPNKKPATKADVERAKLQGTHKGIEAAWAIMFTVLRDKEGMEYEDLRRIWDEVGELSDSIKAGYVTLPDLKHVLKKEAEVVPG